jgi:hypothetical protein
VIEGCTGPENAEPITQIGLPQSHRDPCLYARSVSSSTSVTSFRLVPGFLFKWSSTYSLRLIGANPVFITTTYLSTALGR